MNKLNSNIREKLKTERDKSYKNYTPKSVSECFLFYCDCIYNFLVKGPEIAQSVVSMKPELIFKGSSQKV